MPVFRHLERLTSALAGALTVDETARIVLTELLGVDDVVRVGLALARGGGRELQFVSSDSEALGPHGGVRWCTIDGLSDVPLARTVRSGLPIFVEDDQELARRFPQLADRQQRLGTRSLASIPLVVDGACLGGLLVCWSTPQEHRSDQRGFLAAFAAQVAHAVRRGLAYQVQRTTSEELQRSLLPHSLPDVDRLDFGAHYRPGGGDADVGGDWYDVMPLPDGRVAVSLGDVMGKGVQAAVVMGEIRAATRAYAMLDPDPSRVLERLDQLVSATSPSDQLVTMVYGAIDASRSELHVAVAGHPPPLMISPEEPPTLVGATGPALGLSAGPWHTETIPLTGLGSVLFYSDGLVETRERDLFGGIELLCETVAALDERQRNPRELCARLGDALTSSTSHDDVALLAIAASAPRKSATRTLPADSSAAGLARRFVVGTLIEWAVDEDVVERAELCVSELVTNAVIHSGTEPTVRLRSDGANLVVSVHDHGSQQRIEPVEHDEAESISGRGLSLVQALVSAWNIERTTGGTSVWCELELEPAERGDAPLSARDHIAS